jgi:hypothetical protein
MLCEKCFDRHTPEPWDPDAARLAAALHDHLNKIKRGEGGPIVDFIASYLNDSVVLDLVWKAQERMQLAQRNSDAHSSLIIQSPLCYSVWTFPFGAHEAASWFERQFGGYTLALLRCIDSDPFRNSACEVLIDIAYTQSQVHVSILPFRSSKFIFAPVLASDLLTATEIENISDFNNKIRTQPLKNDTELMHTRRGLSSPAIHITKRQTWQGRRINFFTKLYDFMMIYPSIVLILFFLSSVIIGEVNAWTVVFPVTLSTLILYPIVSRLQRFDKNR